jgi:CHAD domain-containing protein
MEGFCISNTESISKNIHRILLEQIQYILMQSEKSREEVHKSIHETRKSMKRIRAVLRMIRDEIGYSSYYRENTFYRDLGRELSEIRNFEVLSESIKQLQADLSNTIPPGVFTLLEKELERQRNMVLGGEARLHQWLKEISEKVEMARDRIYDFPIRHNDFRVFEGGLRRIYRQGKRSLRTARNDPTPTQLHDLRKKIKYFWYQVEILHPIFPGPMKAYASTLETIAEDLGVYHDLQVLQEFLDESNIIPEQKINETLHEACLAKKSMLLYNICPLAEIAYSEKPAAMINRLASYWKVYTRSEDDQTTKYPTHEK